MDFEPRYTPEQEEFRREVNGWLKENVPDGIHHPADPADLTWDQYQTPPRPRPQAWRKGLALADGAGAVRRRWPRRGQRRRHRGGD